MTQRRRSSTLRRKLLFLLGSFGLYAVLAAGATIYVLQWNLQDALQEFEGTLGQTSRINHLEVGLKEQILLLRDVIDGQSDSVKPLFDAREDFLSLLRQVATFDPSSTDERKWPRLLRLAQEFGEETDHCMDRLRESDPEGAKAILVTRLQGELVPILSAGFRDARAALDKSRGSTTRMLRSITSRVLVLTVLVAVFAAVLVVFGALLLRLLLFQPIGELQEVTERFRKGDLDFRATIRGHDELAALGSAMNEMACALAAARDELQASETKHRLLFENLHDAVVICNADGQVVEYHDSHARLLGVDGPLPVNCYFGDVWPEWESFGDGFAAVIRAVAEEGKRHRAVDIELTRKNQASPSTWIDVLAYRIEYGGVSYAAIVLRDVTQRRRLQRKVRQAETMEAVGTLAGGLAHDFNNLLAGVIGSLSMLATEVENPDHAEKLRAAVQTCWQASSLSRRLLNFAGSAHGEPQIFAVTDAVTVILESLDPSFLEGIEVNRELDETISVRMDRDQFTQIALNLIRNARDAMPDGGTLTVSIGRSTARDPEDPRQERQYVVLCVGDTGTGMSREVQRRVFEPFFTTKSRSSRRGRGMGMAMVYSAVRNAGGFLQIESEPQKGTSISVFLPFWEDATTGHEVPGPTIEPPVRS